jgi:hypothetical protein
VAAVKLCASCLKAIETGKGALCVKCKRHLTPLLTSTGKPSKWPAFWVPEEGEAIGVPGMSGMGKSTLEKAWAHFLMAEGVTVYWWDPAREASVHGMPRARAPLGPLLTQVTVGELEEDPGLLCQVEAGAKRPAVAITPDKEYPGREERAADFVRVMQLILPNKPKGDCVLFIGECGLLEGHREAEEVQVEVATTWRKEDVAAVFDTQSTSMVPDRARRQWKTIVAFKQVDGNDRQALTKLVSRGFSEAVKDLPPHACVVADRMNPSEWEENLEPGESGADEAA